MHTEQINLRFTPEQAERLGQMSRDDGFSRVGTWLAAQVVKRFDLPVAVKTQRVRRRDRSHNGQVVTE